MLVNNYINTSTGVTPAVAYYGVNMMSRASSSSDIDATVLGLNRKEVDTALEAFRKKISQRKLDDDK